MYGYEYGLKTPEFYQEEDFRVVIWRADELQDDPKRPKGDPKEVENLIKLIRNNPSISRAELSRQLSISERQVRNILDQLRAEERLIRKGGTTGKWIIIE